MAYSGAVFPFSHNWADPITERLMWLTDVLTHRDNSEQRIQSRPTPRRQLEYSVLAQNSVERATLDNFIWKYQKGAMLLPIWTDATRLTVATNSGQDEVTVSTPYYDYDAGDYLILWRGYDNYEAVEIDSLTSTVVTLAENLNSTWAAGTVVMPARLARMNQQVRGQSIVPDIRPYRFQFDIDEASVSSNRITAISPQTHLSIDLYLERADRSEQEDYNFEHGSSLVDFQIGGVGIDDGSRENPRLMFGYSQKFPDRSAISDFWGFLDRRQGQRVPFFYSNWDEDFVPVSIGAGVFGHIIYTGNGYADWVDGVAGRRDVAIYRKLLDTTITRQITAASDLGDGTEKIEMGSLHILTEDPEDIRVTLLKYCRLASDIVEMTWHTSCVAETRLAFREMLNSPAL